MSAEVARAERRARVRARLAAERAGTELVTIDVRADDVLVGDWCERIHEQRDATGRVRVRGARFGDDGARVTLAAPHEHHDWVNGGELVLSGDVAIGVDGYDALRVPPHVLVAVRRRVAVDA